MAVEVLELKVAVGVLYRVIAGCRISVGLSLIDNDGGFSGDPIFGFEKGEGDTLVGVILEADFTGASVSGPILVGFLAVVVDIDRNGLDW